MIKLYEWAKRNNISHNAFNDLLQVMGMADIPEKPPKQGTSETAVQTQCRLKVQQLGGRVFRNNVGVLFDDRGVPVRYGLANESAKLNKHIKSSDLIGLVPRLITAEMVGTVIGQFTAIECKRGDWRFTGNEHEEAQARFIGIVNKLGGYATFANTPEVIE